MSCLGRATVLSPTALYTEPTADRSPAFSLHSRRPSPRPKLLPPQGVPPFPAAIDKTCFGTFPPVPTVSIGHGFGIIPAPGSFASSAFPVPPNKSSEKPPKISRVPPKKQTLALGAASSRFLGAPITRAETEKHNVPKQSSSHRLSRQEPGAQVRSS